MRGVPGGSVAASSIGVGMSVAGVLVQMGYFFWFFFFSNNNIIAFFLFYTWVGFLCYTHKLSSSLYIMSDVFTSHKVLC